MSRLPRPCRAALALAAWLLPLLAIPGAARAADLTVSAAASLATALQELGPRFEREHPDTRVLLNTGASGALLQQIAKGAPVDVFASADAVTMDQAQSQGLVVARERRDIASNRLVLVVPAVALTPPTALADLAEPAFARVSMGVPASVPAGRYAQAAMQKAGLWAAVSTKVIGAQNVRQTLDHVARGEVDAGFVYATDAALVPDKVRVAFAVPTELPVRYPVAPVAGSAQGDLARRFVRFLESPAAQAVFAKHGFGAP